MDTKKLTVGQNVYMLSECYINKGKVVKVTPEGVEVQTCPWMGSQRGGELFRFDKDGNEPDVSRRERLGFGPSPESTFHTFLWYSAPEFQPWHIDDMPFAERTVLLEQADRDYKARRDAVRSLDVPKVSAPKKINWASFVRSLIHRNIRRG